MSLQEGEAPWTSYQGAALDPLGTSAVPRPLTSCTPPLGYLTYGLQLGLQIYATCTCMSFFLFVSLQYIVIPVSVLNLAYKTYIFITVN